MDKHFFLLICFIGNFILGQYTDTISEEFSIKTKDNIILKGVIEYPKAKEKLPAVVLIWGNGPHTRDQKISKTSMFKIISDYLTSKGVVVMRFDKRGFGESSIKYKSSESDYTTLDLKDDVQIAIEKLKQHPKVDTTRIGLIGHSEGAMIASILASENKVNWNIQIAPPAVSGIEIDEEQSRKNRIKLGIPDSTSVDIEKAFKIYRNFIKKDFANDSIHYALGKKFLIAHGLKENDERITPDLIDQFLSGFRNKWQQGFYRLDMRTYHSKIKIPTLAIFGSHDENVPIDQNLHELNTSLKKAQNDNYEIIVLPESDHFFLTYKGKRLEKHKLGEMIVSQRLLKKIINFIDNLK